MLERYSGQGLTIVAVNLDQDPAAAGAFLEAVGEGFHHVQNPEGTLPEAYAVTVMPSSLIFDREGVMAYRHDGFHADKVAEYERRIVALLEGRDDIERDVVTVDRRPRRGLGVRPWERGLLADDAMRLDSDPLDWSIDDHIYFSKEASSGGRGFGGGGCGCN